MNKPSIILAMIALIYSTIMTYCNWNELKAIRAELKQPKRVEIISNGSVTSWPVDNRLVKIVEDKE